MRNQQTTKPLLLVLVLWAAPLAACTNTDINPPPDYVFALFDPSGSPPQIPVPNDIAMLGAKPTSVTIASFSAPLDPASIRLDDVIAVNLATSTPLLGIMPSFDASTNHLIIAPPPTGWPVGRVAIVLRGGDMGLHGAGGQLVVATPTFFFARGAQPVSNCAAAAANCTSATPVLSVPQAVALEQLRQGYAPLFAGLEARGIPRDEIVLLWTFTVMP